MNSDSFLGEIVRDEILLNIKSKTSDEFKKCPDINWIGLLINNSEVNKIISPKMNYIYQIKIFYYQFLLVFQFLLSSVRKIIIHTYTNLSNVLLVK